MRIVSLNLGRPAIVVHDGRRYSTAINRVPASDPTELSPSGFAGDRVSDSVNHGGADKAVCCYAHEHYAHFEDKLGMKLQPGAFGENLTLEGCLESEVCIGDIYIIGTATVQITQPRQPCWKLANKHNQPEIIGWINDSGFSGFYLRVLHSGVVGPDEEVVLSARPHADVSVLQAHQARLAKCPEATLRDRLAELEELSASWRRHFQEKRA